MKATITYSLSETGRKASLAAGGNGKQEQKTEGEVDPSALDVLSVSPNGEVSGNATFKSFDSPQTIESLIANLRL